MASKLVPVPLITPGNLGLNTAFSASTDLGPEWCLVAQNTYFDGSGRLAARKGWSLQTPTPITSTPAVEQIFEFVKADTTTAMVLATTDNKLWSGFVSPTNITGTLTPTADNWQFLNFNDKVIGVQAAHTPIVWTGTGNFAAITAASGTLPTGNAGCAAFGRLWIVDADNETIKYCGLLDETNWGAAGSGSINMRNIWTHGTDSVMGIYAQGASLVVFGKRHIVMFTDGRGSTLGMDPAQMYVVDTIEGTGLLARDTVQTLGTGDLLFLSPTGVQSLARLVADKTNPLLTLDLHCWDYINGYVQAEANVAKIRSVYSPVDKYYLLILPSTGHSFCYDTRKYITGSQLVVDGSMRINEWLWSTTPGLVKAAVCTASRSIYFGLAGGIVGLHTGYNDNTSSYFYNYASPFLAAIPDGNGGTMENRLKIPKRLGSVIYTRAANTVTFQWGYNFSPFTFNSQQQVIGGLVPEYGTAEYGTNGVYNVTDPTAIPGTNYSEYAGALVVRIQSVPMTSTGRWLQVGLTATINGSDLAVQELDAYVKAGVVT